MGPEFRDFEKPTMTFEGHAIVKLGESNDAGTTEAEGPAEEATLDGQELTTIE